GSVRTAVRAAGTGQPEARPAVPDRARVPRPDAPGTGAAPAVRRAGMPGPPASAADRQRLTGRIAAPVGSAHWLGRTTWGHRSSYGGVQVCGSAGTWSPERMS